MNTSKFYFDHEKLVAYQRSLQFVAWSSPLLENQSPKLAVFDQLDRASTFRSVEHCRRQRQIYGSGPLPFTSTPREVLLWSAALAWTCS
jgi:hypothetical protein